MCLGNLSVVILWLLQAVVHSTSCATTNTGSFEKFTGIHSSSNGNPNAWEIKFVELANDLVYNVEIINGDKISLLVQGDPSIPPPMIFIHGWMDSRLTWMTIIPHILNAVSSNQILILPTLRGHGDSQIFPIDSSKFDYGEFVNDIRLLLHTLGFTAEHLVYNLVGHSMGGGIAMKAVIDHPNMIQNVVFMDTAPAFDLSEMFTFDAEKDEPTFEQLKGMVKGFNHPQVEKGWMTKQLCHVMDVENLKVNSQAARKSFDGLNVNITDALIETVQQFDIGSMVLFGEHDFVSAQKQREYAKNINAKVVQFDGCGHDPHYKYPRRVAQEIVQFFSDQSDDKRDL
eukprot:272267_1